MNPLRRVGAKARHVSRRGLRRLRRERDEAPVPALGTWDYSSWLEARIEMRGRELTQAAAGLFSVLTCVYDGSPVDLFTKTAESVLRQRSPTFEWVIVAQGLLPEDLESVLREVASDGRVRCVLKPDNVGIMRGLRAAMEAATGRYVLPLDGDDRLLPDALSVLATELKRRDNPAFLYGDEDALIAEQPMAPYLRPDWDPLLNLASSYIWHPSVFDRVMALELGVFTDVGSEFCQDWDTVLRFTAAGIEPAHIAEVLYHWTAHDASSTHRSQPHRGSLRSQRNVLDRALEVRGLTHLFSLEEFPLDRGLPELWPRRAHRDAPDVTVVLVGRCARKDERSLAAAGGVGDFPVRALVALGTRALPAGQRQEIATAWAGLGDVAPSVACVPHSSLPALKEAVDAHPGDWTVVMEHGIVPAREEWLWEAVGLGELVPDIGLLSGRIVDHSGVVRAGGELWDVGELLRCPDFGRHADDPGPYAISLKPHCVSAVHPGFFVARTAILIEALSAVPDDTDPRQLGVWLALWAQENGVRIAYSPLVLARCARGSVSHAAIADAEREAIVARYGGIPSPHPLSSLYRLVGAREGPPDPA